MNVYYKNGKLLIELDKDVGEVNDIIEYLRMKEIFYKSNKLDEKDINKFSEEINESYYQNFLKDFLKKKIDENCN
jgi:iron uptake system EfeUOB component EfeO/EfeM